MANFVRPLGNWIAKDVASEVNDFSRHALKIAPDLQHIPTCHEHKFGCNSCFEDNYAK